MNIYSNLRNTNKKIRKGEKMGTLNQMELQNLRHFIGTSENSYAKFTHYADTAVDPQIKQYFEKIAINALNEKEKIINYL